MRGPLRLGAVLLVVALHLPEDAAGALPWEVWRDLHMLAELPPGDQVLLRSSRCPSGCRYDRHSDGDWRYIRVDGDEGVIFEEAGAGAITRIWMTMGAGVSEPLDPAVRLRLYVDGSDEPLFDLPLPDLFNGSTPPFLPPLVGDRMVSSGGNYSYVPIPYRAGCKITLVGAHEARIWYQLTFHRLAEAGDVVSFTGQEDLSAWAALLAAPGQDPYRLLGQDAPPSPSAAGQVWLKPGSTASLGSFAGPDSLISLRLGSPETAWPKVTLRLTFDGEVRVDLPLSDFFAVGRGGLTSTRSLLLGVTEDGTLYCYFPMPYRQSAEVSLTLPSWAAAGVFVSYALRRSGTAPTASSALFGAALHVDSETPIGTDIPLLDLPGEGKWVGLFAELGSVETLSRGYLEGDERVFLDASPHPALYGTGTEDIFNGGFYFDRSSFRLALHGSPYHLTANGEDTTAAYRLMLSDGVRFRDGLRVGLEGGPTQDLSLRVRTVAYYYQRPTPSLWRYDVFELGDAGSRAAHAYTVAGPFELRPLDALFESEPPLPYAATGVYRPPGEARFLLRLKAPDARHLRLRRRLDAGLPGQEAEVRIGGEVVARFPPVDENADRRWREVDLDLPQDVVPADGVLELTVTALPGPTSGNATFSAFTYELWGDALPALFWDGFESGDLSRWSDSLGQRPEP